MNIALHLARAGRARPDAPATAHGRRVVHSYAQTARRAGALAGALRGRLGLAPGDRVAVLSKNRPEYIEAVYACWWAGLAAVPVNAKLHPSEFRFILDNSGTRVVFAGPEQAAAVGGLDVDGVEAMIVIGSREYEALAAGEPAPVSSRAPDDLAWLFYTSGTTGQPKGAMLSHRNLVAALACYFADVDPGGPWGGILHAAPLSHGSGLYGLAHVLQASCHVLPESGAFESAEIHDLFGHWQALSMFAAPTMVKRLLDEDPGGEAPGMKSILYGGGPMYVEDAVRALDRFGPRLSQLYGQGESPMTITALNARFHAERDHPRWLERLGSVGIAQSVVEVVVADAEDRELPPGETGEVLVRGDSVMLGYWNNPEASAAALAGGWLHTGDVGTMDEEGFLTLKDRSKDVIISGGANIYPREVEEVLMRHPGVREVSVIGRPDRDWGEVVVAFVVAEPGRSADTAALDAFCLEHLARFKRPKHYRALDVLPKNHYGKVLKTSLRELDANPDA